MKKANRFYLGLLPVSALALAGLGSTAASAQDAPPHVGLTSVQFAGPGCPSGTASLTLAQDGRSFDIHNAMWAAAGPGQPQANASKHCVALISLDIPSGWSYAVTSAEGSGYALLDPGVYGRISTRVRFAGMPSTGGEVRVAGPTSGFATVDLSTRIDAPAWSRCGGQQLLMITTTAVVDNISNRSRSGVILVGPAMSYELAWRRCGG